MKLGKKTKKAFVSIIVGLVALGLVAAYIPLLFLRPEQVPQAAVPESGQQQVIVPLTPIEEEQNTTSTDINIPIDNLDSLTGLESESSLLDNLDALLDGSGN